MNDKNIDVELRTSLLGCEGKVVVEITSTDAIALFEKISTEIKRLHLENSTLTAERDEARRLLKAVVNMMRENMVPDATHPKHLCDFIHRPDIAMCRVCEDWTDALVLCYPDDFKDEEDGK